jgi:hypothetical protein
LLHSRHTVVGMYSHMLIYTVRVPHKFHANTKLTEC